MEHLEQRLLLSAAPLNLAATPASQSEINLTWDLGDANDTAIVIERKTGTSGTYQTLVTLPGGENIFTDVSCWAATTYTYRVKTRDASGDSTYCLEQSATAQAVSSGVLALVTNLSATANSPTSATVSFTDPNTADTKRMYFLERSADGVAYQVVSALELATSFTDTCLTPGGTYSYRVRGTSWNAATSDYTAPATIAMPARAAGAPIEPSDLRVTDLTSGSVLLTWKNNDAATVQFKAERAVYDPWHTMTWSQVNMTAAGATSYTDTALTAEHAYVYRIRATSSGVDSDYDTPASDIDHVLFGNGVGITTASVGTGTAKTYDIGPGYTYQNIADLNWTTVGPGDTVNIHYKPGGYHELFMISTRGTPSAWITINGVCDPVTGAPPVIDGLQAVLVPQFANHYTPIDGAGCLVVGTRSGYVAGYQPGYLMVQNLQFTDCYAGNSPNTFTDYDGTTKTYGGVGAGIYLERVDHLTIKNCVVNNNGEGIFGAGQATYDRMMTDVTLDSNYIYNNGNVGSYLEHNTYLEGINTVYQFNHYGPTRSGAGGAGLKDRSVGTIIRYNYIEGGAHQLQLPEAQNQSDLAMALPEYHQMMVYGNFFVAPPGDASSMIFYGGDQGLTPLNRKGTLYLYNNTMVARSNQTGTGSVYKIIAAQMSSPGESVDARNNIFAAIPDTTGANHPDLGLLGTDNMAYFGRNWVTSGYYLGLYSFTGHAGGTANLLAGSSVNPGFVNLVGGDYHLAAGSACIDVTGRLSGRAAAYPVLQEFVGLHAGQTRVVSGTSADLGAFEYAPPLLPGDANKDGKVSFADYLILEQNFGKSGKTWGEGDFTGDGNVKFADYLLLEQNFGKTSIGSLVLAELMVSGPAAVTVAEEPASLPTPPASTSGEQPVVSLAMARPADLGEFVLGQPWAMLPHGTPSGTVAQPVLRGERGSVRIVNPFRSILSRGKGSGFADLLGLDVIPVVRQ